MGLELMRFHALHFLANGHDLVDVHGILGQRALFQQIAQRVAVHGFVHHLIELCPRLGRAAVADGLDQQVAQALIFEGHLAENVKDLAAKGVALFLQLFEEPLIDGAFAGFLRNQIPEMADLRLADTMDAAEALFEAVWIPWQVIIDHQMRALKVDAFTGGVGRNQYAHVLILLEQGLNLAAIVAQHSAVDGHDHFIAPEERADLLGEVVQRVAMLRKNNQLFAIAVGVLHQIIVLQNGGKFIPLPVCSAGANLIRHGLQIAKNINFRLQLRNGCGGGRLIGNRFFLFF